MTVQLLSAQDLVTLGYGSRSTIWRRVRAGNFPQPLRIGNLTRWREDDVLEWLESRTSTGPNVVAGGE